MKDYIKYPLILFIVTASCSLIISVMYYTTNPILIARDEKNTNEFLNSMYSNVSEYEEIEYSGEFKQIQTIYKITLDDSSTRTVYKSAQAGKNGDISMLIGYSPEGILDGIEYVKIMETPNIGMKVTEEPFLETVLNQDSKSVNVDTISGATISSTAVKTMVEITAKDFNDNGGYNE